MQFTWGAATLDLTEFDKVDSNQLPTITITFHAHPKLCCNHTALLSFLTTAESSSANTLTSTVSFASPSVSYLGANRLYLTVISPKHTHHEHSHWRPAVNVRAQAQTPDRA